MRAVSRTDFLHQLRLAAPLKILKIPTDNGSQFTDRLTSRQKMPSGHHAFDHECASLSIVSIA